MNRALFPRAGPEAVFLDSAPFRRPGSWRDNTVAVCRPPEETQWRLRLLE